MSSALVKIRHLARHAGQEVTVGGWVSHLRSKGKIAFLVLRDGTGWCQAVASAKELDAETFDALRHCGHESSVRVKGLVRADSRAPGGFELGVTGFEIVTESADYPIGRKEHGSEFLFDHRHLWLRHKKPWAALRVRDELAKGIRDFFYDREFVLIDSPLLTPAACEGTSTLFETDYFGSSAYLSQSGQLYLEPACQAFDKVYCFGPTFRAEKSKTRRHLTEFWMIEPELAWAGLEEILELAEELITYLVGRVLDRRSEELSILERDTSRLEAISAPFPRISYDEAAEFLARPENLARVREAGAPPFEYGNDLGAMDETLLGEQHDRPVMIHRYPAQVKAFYMEPDPDDPSKALCVDVIAPEGYGEIIGGSVRIHDSALLETRVREHGLPEEAFAWFLDVRRYGGVPHAGFGMGFERVVAWVCGLRHLREAIPYPRTIQRLYP